MRKRVLLLALTSVMMSFYIPAFAQQPQSDSTVALRDIPAELIEKVKSYDMTIKERVKKDKTISDCYVIEIGAISDQNRARPAYREEFTKKTYQVPEGITVKELILSLSGIKRNVLGRLVAKKSKKTIRCIHFNSQWVIPDNTDHLYYTNQNITVRYKIPL